MSFLKPKHLSIMIVKTPNSGQAFPKISYRLVGEDYKGSLINLTIGVQVAELLIGNGMAVQS